MATAPKRSADFRKVTVLFGKLISQVSIVLLATSSIAYSTQNPSASGAMTIPQKLARVGRSLGNFVPMGSGYFVGDKNAPSTARSLAETDVIVEGTVGLGRSYLSEDQREVYTDYEILAPVFHLPTYDNAVPSSERSAREGSPLVVTILGGSVTINGLTFTSDHEALPSLQPDAKVLLLLKRDGKRYWIAQKYYGAFSLNHELVPLTKDRMFDFEYRGMTSEAATQRLVRQRMAMGSKR